MPTHPRRRALALAVAVALLGPATACRRPVDAPEAPRRATDAAARSAAADAGPPPARGGANGGAADTPGILARLGGEPCADSDLTCVRLRVPRDHGAPDGPSIEVVFGVLPATGARQGLFVTAVGGPGVSGLGVAQSYVDALAPDLREHFDLAFFDQRGIGRSSGVACPDAAADYYATEWLGDTPEQEAATVAAARAFAGACVRELGGEEALGPVGTDQVVEDLEAFRKAMGDERFWLYGESYGTQLGQAYGERHGEHLAGLILDGPVDPAISATEFLAEQARAYEAMLVATLAACDADPDCAADAGGDAMAVYDQLAERLRHAPAEVAFPMPDGGTEARTFSLADLESATSGNLADPLGRLQVQRAVAAARRGDLVPFVRLAYDDLLIDPQTEESEIDPTFSDASFYAIECADYALAGASPAERAAAYMRQGDAIDREVTRLGSSFYSDLACAFWPRHDDETLASAAAARLAGIPTLVLTATGDPTTPPAQARRIAGRLADGYLITTMGGDHVTYGRGAACPDDLVDAFLLDGTPPTERDVACDGEMVEAYVPLPPTAANAFEDPLAALATVDAEMSLLPEYLSWSGFEPLSIGCPAGGRLTLGAFDFNGRSALSLASCAFVPGLVLDGSGIDDADAGELTLEVAVSGLAEGSLSYLHDADGRVAVDGVYDGEPVALEEAE